MRRITIGILLLLIPCSLFAWGNTGHRVTAGVAEKRLKPATLQKALKLLGTAHLSDVATDPDTWKSNPGEFRNAEWHFVDTPLASTYDAKRDCAFSDCVIERVDQFQAILADPKEDPKRRREALVYVIHFMGDLHQPLHCETGRLANGSPDRGGNLIPVTFLGKHLDPPSVKNDDLHFFWDVTMIDNEHRANDDAFVTHLLTDTLNGRDVKTLTTGKTVEWAAESHKIAQTVQVKPKTDLTAAYADANTKIVDERLLRGGLRLAAVLETALGAN